MKLRKKSKRKSVKRLGKPAFDFSKLPGYNFILCKRAFEVIENLVFDRAISPRTAKSFKEEIFKQLSAEVKRKKVLVAVTRENESIVIEIPRMQNMPVKRHNAGFTQIGEIIQFPKKGK